MKKRGLQLGLFVLSLSIAVACLDGAARAQKPEDVLVDGNPPLTQLMAGKVIVLLDWALELKLSKDQELEIKQHLLRTWRGGKRAEMQGALDIIEIYEKVFRMNEAERNASRSKLHDIMLQSIRSQPNDSLAVFLLAAYDMARGKSRPNVLPSPNTIGSAAKNKMRVGGDGFTGIYRMVRPRAVNINNSGFEPGFWIEYITFLPDGHVYWTLPPEGLLYFDAAVARRADPNDWGTYEMKNGEIHILRGPQREPYVITRAGERLNNPPSLGKGSFRPIPAADGLRLDGTYRRGDTEPTITFSADGRFQDAGIFRFFGTGQRPDGTIFQDDGRGGSGTYVIEQNTLELKYSDGRVKRAPFIAFPEDLAKKPFVNSFILRREERMQRL